MTQFSNISGSEQQPFQMHQSMSTHQYNMFNHAGRNVMSCTNKAFKNSGGYDFRDRNMQ